MKQSNTTGADYSSQNGKIAIVSARFNGEIVEAMRIIAYQTLIEHGVKENNIIQANVPGAFELPLVCKQYAQSNCDAVIALGCVIRGETPHFDYVCNSTAIGIQNASLDTNTPIAFGVLTTNTIEQAKKRSSPSNKEENKGRDAALCVLEMINVLKAL